MYQCGVPKEMAIELFKPFVMKRLVETQKANNIKGARKMVEHGDPAIWDALEVVIKNHPCCSTVRPPSTVWASRLSSRCWWKARP